MKWLDLPVLQMLFYCTLGSMVTCFVSGLMNESLSREAFLFMTGFFGLTAVVIYLYASLRGTAK